MSCSFRVPTASFSNHHCLAVHESTAFLHIVFEQVWNNNNKQAVMVKLISHGAEVMPATLAQDRRL